MMADLFRPRHDPQRGRRDRGKVFCIKGFIPALRRRIATGYGGKIEQLAVQQMRGGGPLQAVEYGFDPAREFLFPLPQQLFHLLSLQLILRAAQGAGNNGEGAHLGVAREGFFLHIRERSYHHVPAVIGRELRRHGLQLAAEEQVQEKGFQNVVAMVAQGDPGGAELARQAVEHAAAQARAQRTHGFAFGNQALDHRIGILRRDQEFDAQRLQVIGQDMRRIARMLLIEIDRDKVERYRRQRTQLEQHVEQAIAVFAAGEADHDAVAGFDHVEIGDRLSGEAAQALLQLVCFEALLLQLLVIRRVRYREQARSYKLRGSVRYREQARSYKLRGSVRYREQARSYKLRGS